MELATLKSRMSIGWFGERGLFHLNGRILVFVWDIWEIEHHIHFGIIPSSWWCCVDGDGVEGAVVAAKSSSVSVFGSMLACDDVSFSFFVRAFRIAFELHMSHSVLFPIKCFGVFFFILFYFCLICQPYNQPIWFIFKKIIALLNYSFLYANQCTHMKNDKIEKRKENE